mmetsp:Transcript_22489/g.58482  ORF Transcript_22489/g.58482 Transcript_22489/m.58482 type:complete len:291 (+) Transcript_22489:563-1435(+)
MVPLCVKLRELHLADDDIAAGGGIIQGWLEKVDVGLGSLVYRAEGLLLPGLAVLLQRRVHLQDFLTSSLEHDALPPILGIGGGDHGYCRRPRGDVGHPGGEWKSMEGAPTPALCGRARLRGAAHHEVQPQRCPDPQHPLRSAVPQVPASDAPRLPFKQPHAHDSLLRFLIDDPLGRPGLPDVHLARPDRPALVQKGSCQPCLWPRDADEVLPGLLGHRDVGQPRCQRRLCQEQEGAAALGVAVAVFGRPHNGHAPGPGRQAAVHAAEDLEFRRCCREQGWQVNGGEPAHQ